MAYPGFDKYNHFNGPRDEELEYFKEFKKKNRFPHPIDYMQWEQLTFGDNIQPLTPYQGQKCYAIH